jgi:hypothetical protein
LTVYSPGLTVYSPGLTVCSQPEFTKCLAKDYEEWSKLRNADLQDLQDHQNLQDPVTEPINAESSAVASTEPTNETHNLYQLPEIETVEPSTSFEPIVNPSAETPMLKTAAHDIRGTFSDILGSFDDIQGSFDEIQGTLADILGTSDVPVVEEITPPPHFEVPTTTPPTTTTPPPPTTTTTTTTNSGFFVEPELFAPPEAPPVVSSPPPPRTAAPVVVTDPSPVFGFAHIPIPTSGPEALRRRPSAAIISVDVPEDPEVNPRWAPATVSDSLATIISQEVEPVPAPDGIAESTTEPLSPIISKPNPVTSGVRVRSQESEQTASATSEESEVVIPMATYLPKSEKEEKIWRELDVKPKMASAGPPKLQAGK